MIRIGVGVALGAALIAGGVQAADFMPQDYGPPPVAAVPAPLPAAGPYRLRTVCDPYGRCWRERVTTIVERYEDAPRPRAPVGYPVYRQPVYPGYAPDARYEPAPVPRVYAPAEFGADDNW